MKKINLISTIGSLMICVASSITFNSGSYHIEKTCNDTNVIKNNLSIKHASYKKTRNSSYAAIVSIFAHDGNKEDASSSFFNFNGHAFITIENLNSNTIKAGKMNVNAYETVSLGTWGNKNQHKGLWYNLESYFASNGEYDGRISLSMYVNSSELETLNSYINSHDLWAPLSNCSSFATGAWNTISSIKLSAGWINTPSNLKGNIKNNSYVVNKPINFNSNVGYYNNDTFIYVDMNSRSILDSEMFNPNGL